MARTIFLFVGLLAGCAPETRDIALADIDLKDMQTVQTIRADLQPQEGIAFANYVARHHIASAEFCGQPLLRSDGKAPTTIGEAIDLAMLRDAAEHRASMEAKRPKHPRKLAREEWDKLILERDIVIDAQTRLRAEFGVGIEQRRDWKSLESRMTAVNKRLVALKPSVFGSDS